MAEQTSERGIARRASFAPHPEGCTCKGRQPQFFNTERGSVVIAGQAATMDLAKELGIELPAGGAAVVVTKESLEKHLSGS